MDSNPICIRLFTIPQSSYSKSKYLLHKLAVEASSQKILADNAFSIPKCEMCSNVSSFAWFAKKNVRWVLEDLNEILGKLLLSYKQENCSECETRSNRCSSIRTSKQVRTIRYKTDSVQANKSEREQNCMNIIWLMELGQFDCQIMSKRSRCRSWNSSSSCNGSKRNSWKTESRKPQSWRVYAHNWLE